MDSILATPLERAREGALLVLSRALFWGFMPLACLIAAVLLLDSEHARRTALLVYPPVVLVASFAWLLRPSPNRPLARRGLMAIVGVSFISGWGLLMNGPRAANAAGVAMVLSLAVLFLESWDSFLAVVIGNSAVGVLGVLLREAGVLHPTPQPLVAPALFDVSSGLIMVLGLGFSAYVLWVTLENYRSAQQALKKRSEELLAAQEAAQLAQRQQLIARLSTALAGEVAEQLDALRDAELQLSTGAMSQARDLSRAHVHEAHTRATQTLRLLESLGSASSDTNTCADVASVFRRLEGTLRPTLGAGQTLELLNSATGRPQLDASELEQILVYLALQVKDGHASSTVITVRSYDGLGDVTRSDGRRTWTIFEVGCLCASSGTGTDAVVAPPAANDIGALLVELVAGNIGGRLEVERPSPHCRTFVLQLPSS